MPLELSVCPGTAMLLKPPSIRFWGINVSQNSEPRGFKTSTNPFRWGVLVGVWLSYFCFGLTMVTLAPLVTEISADLNLTHSQMGTVLAAWQSVYIFSAIPLGILLDRAGTRRSIMFAFAMIAISVALRANASGHASLFLAVAVFGLGGPLISVGAPKTISLWFEGKERGLAMGVYMTAPTLGSMVGLSLTNSLFMPMFDGNWRSVLMLYAVFIASVSLVWWLITAHKACRAAESQQAKSPRQSQSGIFLRLIKIPAFRIVLTMAVGIFFINHAFNNWLPEILRSKDMNAVDAGYLATLPVALAVVSSLAIPRLATPKRRIPILFCLFTGLGLASLALQAPDGPVLIAALILQGLARGSAMTLCILVLLDIPNVGSERAGVAGGMFFSAAELGGVMGPLSIGVVSDMSSGFSSPLYMMTGVSVILLGLLIILRHQTTS